MRLLWPAAIAGQPCSWAGVGAGKARTNHSRTRGWKGARAGLSGTAVALTGRW